MLAVSRNNDSEQDAAINSSSAALSPTLECKMGTTTSDYLVDINPASPKPEQAAIHCYSKSPVPVGQYYTTEKARNMNTCH